MNKTIRSIATAAAFTGVLLTASACGGATGNAGGSGAAPAAESSQSTSAPAPAKRSSPPGGELNVTFEPALRNGFIHADWKGAPGWTHRGIDQMVALPNHLGYAFSGKSRNSSGFEIYNDEGKVVASVKTPREIVHEGGVLDHNVFTMWQDGKMYVVYVQTGGDANDDAVNILTSFDEDANEVSRKVVTGSYTFYLDQGAVLIRDYEDSGNDAVLNPATGEFDVVPEDTPERKWSKRVNGVDIFVEENKVIIDKLELPYNSVDYAGRYIAVQDTETYQCTIIDVQTGKPLEGSNGGCFTHFDHGDPEDNIPSSYVDGIILEKRVESATRNSEIDDVLFLPSEKKSATISDAENFTPLSVDAKGVFYGLIGGVNEDKVPAFIDVKNDGKLTALTDAKQVPVLVTGNGIAAFSTGENYSPGHSYFGDMQFVLPKK